MSRHELMKFTDEQIAFANSYEWWHTIRLATNYVTPGVCPEPDFKSFGFPDSFHGLSVLDIGCWDGLFSFEAEARDAGIVTGVDNWGPCYSMTRNPRSAQYARAVLKSRVQFEKADLFELHQPHDVVLCFGVLYHVENPLGALRKLEQLTNEYCLLETAVLNQKQVPHDPTRSLLGFDPGFYNDPTNLFYPTIEWLKQASLHVGFKGFELVYQDVPENPWRVCVRLDT